MTDPRPRRRSTAAAFAALLLVVAACGDSAAPAVPAQVTVTAGDQQAVTVGEAAPIPLTVKVTTQGGGAVQGEEVVWRVVSGSATVDPDTSSTDAGGVATTTLRMGQSAGEVTVSATVRDLAPATFVLEAVPGEASSVVIVGGNNQTGPVGQPLPDPVVVEARDAAGNPVPGATIEFSSLIGSLSPRTVDTDAQGRASATWTLPTTPGEHDAVAQLAGSTAGALLEATAVAGAPVTLERVSGDAQQAAPGTAVSNPLVVRVLDSFGNPVPGVDVAFSTPDGGSFAPAQPVTGAQGMAQTTWTLGSDTTRVDQTATATVPGAGSVTFTAIANDPCDDFLAYTLGSSVQGQLTALDCSDGGFFTDLYRMELSEQRIFDVSVISTAFAPGLTVVPPGIFAAAGGGQEIAFAMVGAPGVYGLFPSSENLGATGGYTLSTTLRDSVPSGCELIVLAGSVQFAGAITASDCGPIPGVQVPGRHDELYTVFRPGTVSASMSSDAFDPVLVLVAFSQSGVSVVATAQGQAGQQPATLQYAVPQAGLYVLLASAPDSTATGAYQVATTVQASGAIATPAVRAERTTPFRLPVPGVLRREPALRD